MILLLLLHHHLLEEKADREDFVWYSMIEKDKECQASPTIKDTHTSKRDISQRIHDKTTFPSSDDARYKQAMHYTQSIK